VLIACPGNAMTAGPEAIHQLASDLIRLGHNAAVVYFPFSKEFETPKPYIKYQVPIIKYRDIKDELFIFPEIVTTYALKLRHAQAAIWWMSVNNYTCVRYGFAWRDKLRYLKNVAKGLRPIGGIKSLRKLKHFAQSHYALDYLKSNCIPNWHFFPLSGFDREELANKFLESKLYIDFGHHPGKDRLPREAAIHGCCVITGLYGSASNSLDVNIPSSYKIDPQAKQFIDAFKEKVSLIFNDFEKCAAEFSEYRETISQEQIRFDQQISHIFSIPSK